MAPIRERTNNFMLRGNSLMKKLLSIALVALILLSAVPLSVSAVDYLPLTSNVEEEILSGAEALIAKIENMPNNTYTPSGSGKTYYVSNSGKSTNSGTSQNSPISFDKFMELISSTNSVAVGSVFLFKRGDTFRLNGTELKPKIVGGLTFSAYGEGAKPKFMNSIAAEGEENWELTSTPNVWKYVGEFSDQLDYQKDIGNIVFNGGEGWGIKVVRKNASEAIRVDLGKVFNGYEAFMSGGDPADDTGLKFSAFRHNTPFTDQSNLSNNLEYYHNYDDSTLYLYFNKGNPGKMFDSIELVLRGNMIYIGSSEAQNYTIDNLAFVNTGSHGVSFNKSQNCTVKNCTFEWIGGSIQHPERYANSSGDCHIRYGNAVQNWDSCTNFTVDHCYATQIYDCGFTSQYNNNSTVTVLMDGISITNTVTSYSNSGPEVWLTNTLREGYDNYKWSVKNLDVSQSYVLYGGYGWGHQRYNKDSNFFYGGLQNDYVTTYENCNYHDNYFFKARHTGIKARYAKSAGTANGGHNFNNNVFVMGEGQTLVQTGENLADCTGTSTFYTYNQSTVTNLVNNGFFTGSTFYYYDLADSTELDVEKMDLGQDVRKPYPHISVEDLDYILITASNMSSYASSVQSKNYNGIMVNYAALTSAVTLPLSSMSGFDNINVKEYPFIKIGYMTNDTAITSPVTLKYKTDFAKKDNIFGNSTTSTEATFSGPTIAVNVSGNREKSIVDIKATTNTHDQENPNPSNWLTPAVVYSWDAIESSAVYKELTIDPWNGGSASSGRFYGISYIAFFKDIQSASQFGYPTRPGDVNDDLKVDMLDEILMSRYFAAVNGWTLMPSFIGADSNGDDFVSAADHTVIARYLAGWTKYAALPYEG